MTPIGIVEDEQGAGTVHIPATIALLTFTTFAVLDHIRRVAVQCGQQTGSKTIVNSQGRRPLSSWLITQA